MARAILTLNAGSSSVKFALFAVDRGRVPPRADIVGEIEGLRARPRFKAADATGRTLDDRTLDDGDPAPTGDGPHRQALAFLREWLLGRERDLHVVGVGHRVVHGGERHLAPVRLDEGVVASLREFVPLAPLHQPHNLAGIEAMAAALPGVPQVACFDTAFHRDQPELARRFALPRAITAQGVRRHGFHGLSYEYIADILPRHLGDRAEGRVIVAHLGNGASLCALKHRRSVATTTGLTALDGLVMGTRCGSLDPGVLLYLMDHRGMDGPALERLLYEESGLLGVSGISADMRELLASDRPEAREAVELFCYRAVREIGSLAAALGGLDALVFTAGIGEHAPPVRARICAALEWLGVKLDPGANEGNARRIAAADGAVEVLVLPTNEEWMIARHTAALLG